MWNYVGIVRTDKRLERARAASSILRDEIQRVLLGLPGHARPDRAAQPRATWRDLIVACAQRRKESRGLHYTLSWTGELPPRDTVLVRGKPAPSA